MEKNKKITKSLKLNISSDLRVVGTGGLILSLLSFSNLDFDGNFYVLIVFSFAIIITGYSIKIREDLK